MIQRHYTRRFSAHLLAVYIFSFQYPDLHPGINGKYIYEKMPKCQVGNRINSSVYYLVRKGCVIKKGTHKEKHIIP